MHWDLHVAHGSHESLKSSSAVRLPCVTDQSLTVTQTKFSDLSLENLLVYGTGRQKSINEHGPFLSITARDPSSEYSFNQYNNIHRWIRAIDWRSWLFRSQHLSIQQYALSYLGFQSESIKHNLDAPIKFRPTPSIGTTLFNKGLPWILNTYPRPWNSEGTELWNG